MSLGGTLIAICTLFHLDIISVRVQLYTLVVWRAGLCTTTQVSFNLGYWTYLFKLSAK